MAAHSAEKCSGLAKALWKLLWLPFADSHSVALPRRNATE